jgi:membrane-bound lytic murein transglycosylase D
MAKRYIVFLLVGLMAGCQMPVRPVSGPSDTGKNSPARPGVAAKSAGQVKSLAGLTVADGLDGSEDEDEQNAGEVEDVADGCVVPVDPETLEDMELLSDVDKLPPEDEGVTAVEGDQVYDISVVENEKVRYFIDYYANRGSRGFRRWLERSGRYLPMMQAIFAEEGLPRDLTYLAMIESGFNEKACSRANAVGPWQFMAGTGKMYGLQNEWWRDERRDPIKSTIAAAHHLRDLHARFEGDWNLAIAAYNAGAGKVSQAIRNSGSRDFWKLSREGHLHTETRNYLPKLFAVLHIAKNPAKYGFEDIHYQEPLAYDEVALPSSTDLDIVARLCGVEYDAIQRLNPELKRWCTPPGIKDYKLRIPVGKRDVFLTAYAGIPANQRANYSHYRIRSGDTLGALAARFGVKTRDIMTLNHIKSPRSLRIGTDLILPLSPDYAQNALASLGDDYDRTPVRSHKVRQGDTLWKIARRYNMTPAQLAAKNGMRVDGVLRPGKVLKVAGSAAVPARSAETYKVRSGDNLWTIAKRFGVSTDRLCAWNDLSKASVLKPGMVLKLSGVATGTQPRKIVYQVRSGDSLWSISRRFSLSVVKIRNWNNLANNQVLRPGQKLTLHVSSDHRG